MPVATAWGRISRALAHPNYGRYVAGNSVSLVGTWMQRVAVGWVAWQLTGSGAWLGIVAFADLFPSVLIGPIAGAIADRIDQRRVIFICQTLAGLQSVALAVLTATDTLTIELLAGLALFHGLVIGFNQPARLALIPDLVPREDLPAAVAINAVVFNLARFIGPAVAGLLIVSVGVAAAFAANALSYVALLVALAGLRLPPGVVPQASRQSLAADIVDGVAYTARHPGIGPLMALQLVLAIGARPFVELLPGYAETVFGGGAGLLAALSSVIGLGAILAAIWLAQRPSESGLTAVTLASSLGVALSTLAFAAAPHAGLALAAAAAAGLTMILSAVGAQTLIQLAVEPRLRARVLGLYGILIRGGPAIGALIVGALSGWLGLRWPLAGGAVLSILIWAWAWRRRRRVVAAFEVPA